MDIKHLRLEYQQQTLERESLLPSPFGQFERWFQEALTAGVVEPNALALATSTLQGRPSCRMVLMKEFDTSGLSFFTNIYSRKGIELTENPHAFAVFWWKELERQVMLEGEVVRLSHGKARTYFSKRPRESQLGTLSSRQDERIPSRDFLEKERQRLSSLYEGKEVPLPADWGGFKLIPNRFEFWQGRPNRLHDRFCYAWVNGMWTIDRLSP